MRHLIVTGLAAATLLATVGPAQAHSTRENSARERCVMVTKAQVEGMFTNFNAAWATKNPQTVTNLFAPDAVLLATVSNTPRTTPLLIKDYFETFLKNSPVGTIDSSTTTMGCNTATRVGTWTVALTNPTTKAVTNVKARYSFIYRYARDGWKIYHLHSSMMPEPTS